MVTKTKPFVIGDDFLQDRDEAVAYISDALDEVGPEHLKAALRGVAHTKGMTELAEQAGMSRSGLYKALSEDGDPRLSTVFAILNALGLRISLMPIENNDAA